MYTVFTCRRYVVQYSYPYIASGFLGSGKTTFLQHILKEHTSKIKFVYRKRFWVKLASSYLILQKQEMQSWSNIWLYLHVAAYKKFPNKHYLMFCKITKSIWSTSDTKRHGQQTSKSSVCNDEPRTLQNPPHSIRFTNKYDCVLRCGASTSFGLSLDQIFHSCIFQGSNHEAGKYFVFKQTKHIPPQDYKRNMIRDLTPHNATLIHGQEADTIGLRITSSACIVSWCLTITAIRWTFIYESYL